MAIVDKVDKIVKEYSLKFANDPKFVELREFYFKMQKLGIAQKQEYSLPPLDTVGREILSSNNNEEIIQNRL